MNQKDALAQAYPLFQNGQFDAAYRLLQPLADAVASPDPASTDLLHLAGATAAARGEQGAAIRYFRRALEAAPGDVAISYKLARVLIDADQPQQALTLYLELIAGGVRHADVFAAAAMLLQQFQRNEEALQTVQQALQLAPQAHGNWYLQAILLARLQQLSDAVHSLQQAVALAPGHVRYQHDLALALYGLQRDDEALAANDRARALEPQGADIWSLRAALLSRMGRYEDAIASCETALALVPGDADARVNLALSLMTLGQLERGLPLHEARWQGELADAPRHQHIAPWHGSESLVGKTILLWAEQGLGDSLQFCRYALQVVALGAQVILEVPAELVRLLQTLTPDPQIVVKAMGEALPAADYQIPLMSLPLAFDTRVETIPAAPSYLRSDPLKRAHWEHLLTHGESARRLRIGVVCSGNARNRKDARRSVPLAKLAPLLDLPDADFYLLQPELRQADHAALSTLPRLQWPGRQLLEFDDTAALIDNLDLVISVDTAVAHLAGALGVPVWVLLPYAPDWRWFLVRDDSPWYPSARLWRQQRPGDWDELVGRVRMALSRWPKT